jgi:hypothetical protein
VHRLKSRRQSVLLPPRDGYRSLGFGLCAEPNMAPASAPVWIRDCLFGAVPISASDTALEICTATLDVIESDPTWR